jgi:hypothetical protein
MYLWEKGKIYFEIEEVIINASRCQPVRLAYQSSASSTFLSEQISHQQPASSTLLSEQTSTSHQPTEQAVSARTRDGPMFDLWSVMRGVHSNYCFGFYYLPSCVLYCFICK